MIVGKREFSKNPSKYMDLAHKQDVVISHRGKAELVLKRIDSDDVKLMNVHKQRELEKIIRSLEACLSKLKL